MSSADARREEPADAAVVRPATEGDCGQLADNLRAINTFERRDMTLPQLSAADLARDGFGADPAFSCVVADAGGQLVGHAIYTRGYLGYDGIGRCLFLADLFVRESHRRRGIGRRLMQEVAAAGVRSASPHIEFTVYGWNEPALRFYESLGCRSATDECQLLSFFCSAPDVRRLAEQRDGAADPATVPADPATGPTGL